MNSQPLTSQTASGEQLPHRGYRRNMLILETASPARASPRRLAAGSLNACLLCLSVLQGEKEGEGAGRAVEEVGGLGAEAGP